MSRTACSARARTRAAIRRWQEARGVPPTGYLASTEAELLSAAAALPTSRSDTAATTPALDSTSSAPPDLTARAGDGSTVAQLAAPTNPNSAVLETLPTAEDSPRPEPQTDRTPAARATAPAQLPPDIMLDSYLLRAEESVRADDRAGALAAMEQIDALQAEHELRLGCEAPASFLWLTRAFRNSGAKWDRSPELVNDHDFRSDAEGLAVPYGIYDPRANAAPSSSAEPPTPRRSPSTASRSGGASRAASTIPRPKPCRSWPTVAAATVAPRAPGNSTCNIASATGTACG